MNWYKPHVYWDGVFLRRLRIWIGPGKARNWMAFPPKKLDKIHLFRVGSRFCWALIYLGEATRLKGDHLTMWTRLCLFNLSLDINVFGQASHLNRPAFCEGNDGLGPGIERIQEAHYNSSNWPRAPKWHDSFENPRWRTPFDRSGRRMASRPRKRD